MDNGKAVDALMAVVEQACRVARVEEQRGNPDYRANLKDAVESLIHKMNAFYKEARTTND